jgi:sarcosine oxidase/L-pipecolate oxidase
MAYILLAIRAQLVT